jgi:hypothetical protein
MRDRDVLALCGLVLRRAKVEAAHQRKWRKTHLDARRAGPNREFYLAKQREYSRRWYYKHKRKRLTDRS